MLDILLQIHLWDAAINSYFQMKKEGEEKIIVLCYEGKAPGFHICRKHVFELNISAIPVRKYFKIPHFDYNE
jgi:hypothetical protein